MGEQDYEIVSYGLQYQKWGWLLMLTTAVVVGYILWGIFLARRKAGAVTIRRIAGLDQIDEAVGRATETARPVLMVPGLGALDGITVQALTIFASIIRTAARFATPIRLLNYNPAVFAVAQEIAKDVYQTEGVPDRYDVDSVRFVSDRQFAFAAAVAGAIRRDQVAAAFYMGDFFAESLIMAENANMVGAIQVAATTQYTQTPFFIAACDYVLLGDEFYAASAYLGREPVLLGSLVGADWAKLTFMLFAVIALVVHSVQATRPLTEEQIRYYEEMGTPVLEQQTYPSRNEYFFKWITRIPRG
jgi:hypothetical protein